MANTYTQIHLQFVFAPKFRASLIHPDWEDELYQYITGIVQNNNHKLLSINGMPDHVHLLAGFRTTQSIGDFMQDVKAYSSGWINENKLTKSKFEWQSGYGAFSYSKSHVPNVIAYIKNQKAHHSKQTFLEEYKLFLEKFEIDFDPQYIFKEPV
jgi:putative transposase